MSFLINGEISKNVRITPVIAPSNAVAHLTANLVKMYAANKPNKLPTMNVPTIQPITDPLLAVSDINPKLYGKIIKSPQTAMYVKTPRVIYKNLDPQNAITAPKTSSKKPMNFKNLLITCSTGDKSIPQPCSPEYAAMIKH